MLLAADDAAPTAPLIRHHWCYCYFYCCWCWRCCCCHCYCYWCCCCCCSKLLKSRVFSKVLFVFFSTCLRNEYYKLIDFFWHLFRLAPPFLEFAVLMLLLPLPRDTAYPLYSRVSPLFSRVSFFFRFSPLFSDFLHLFSDFLHCRFHRKCTKKRS